MSLCPTHGATQTNATKCPFCEIQTALKAHADILQRLMGEWELAQRKQIKADNQAKTIKRAV